MNRLSHVLACVFGYMFIGLALLVGTETLGRKLFNFSLQGADELSGYILAVGSCLTFAVATVGKNHIRIDVFYGKMPKWLKVTINLLSVTGLAFTAMLMTWSAYHILVDTIEYQSTAPTPWATPLVYPQSFWFAGLAFFCLIACVPAIKALFSLLKGDVKTLLTEYAPPSAAKEVQEELEDLNRRNLGNTEEV